MKSSSGVFFSPRALFIVIIAAVIFIYFPSLFHLPRADQLWYLLDTSKCRGLFSLIKDSYSYNRIRLYAPGDTLAFRPLMFIFLSLQQYLLGNNFFLGQLIGVTLHLLVIWRMIKLLCLFREAGLLPYAFAAYFASLPIILDMVVWQHINSYLLFIVLVLIALQNIFVYVREGKITKLFVAFICMLAAGFTYEAGLAFAFLFCLYLWAATRRLRWQYLLFILPIAVYLFWDIADYRSRWFYLSQLGLDKYDTLLIGQINFSNLQRIIGLSFSMLGRWFIYGVFPCLFKVFSGPRFGIKMVEVFRLSPAVILNSASVALLAVYFLRSISFAAFRRRINFILLIAAMLWVYLGFIVICRVLERGITNAFEMCTYYSYFAWAFFILIAYCLIDEQRIKKIFRGWQRWVIAAALGGLLYLNATQVFKVNLGFAEAVWSKRIFLARVGEFIKQRRGETDFSFRISPHPPEDERLGFIELQSRMIFYLTDIFFGRYIHEAGAKYTISYGLLPGEDRKRVLILRD